MYDILTWLASFQEEAATLDLAEASEHLDSLPTVPQGSVIGGALPEELVCMHYAVELERKKLERMGGSSRTTSPLMSFAAAGAVEVRRVRFNLALAAFNYRVAERLGLDTEAVFAIHQRGVVVMIDPPAIAAVNPASVMLQSASDFGGSGSGYAGRLVDG